MLYRFLKVLARLGIRIYCRKLVINKPEMVAVRGPVLLACNHPNSFLDSIILDTIFHEPVWSLARGDAFKKPFYNSLLHKLKILPVYRTSEGVENLSENYKTFDACIELFRQGSIVTIFSEGKCINEWHLRPLKKGTARLALKAWEENIPLHVLPVGINYSSFTSFGKNVFINFGEFVGPGSVDRNLADGSRHAAFNALLKAQLEKLVFEIPKEDKKMQKEKLNVPNSLLKRILLAFPALVGLIIHFPLFYPIKRFTYSRTRDNDHYDSVIVALHFVSYPIYLILLTLLSLLLVKSWWMISLLIVIPFTAWAYVQLKPQPDNE